MKPTMSRTHSATSLIPDIISEDVLALLRAHGVSEAHLFGSVARGTAHDESDLDLLVTFDGPVTLFQRMDLADELSRMCGRKVDLLTRIDPAFAPYILPTLVPLPL